MNKNSGNNSSNNPPHNPDVITNINANNELVIKVDNLNFSFGQTRILQNISFRVKKGERVVVLGENGSGKSTLFLCLLHLLQKNKGDISIFGEKVNIKTAPLIRKRVGFVFQDPNEHLFLPTVMDELNFGPYNQGLRQKELEERIRNTIEKLGLNKFMDKKTFQLSFGEKRRVSFGTVQAMKPDLYLLDEPFVSLDPKNQDFLANFLQELADEGKTLLMISHELEQIPEVFNRAIVLHEGKIIYDGSLVALYQKPELIKQANLKVPKMTELISNLYNSNVITREEYELVLKDQGKLSEILQKNCLK